MLRILTWSIAPILALELSACGGASPVDGDDVDSEEAAEDVDSVASAVCASTALTSASPGPMPSNSSVVLTASAATCDPGQTAQYQFLYRRSGGPTTYTEFRAWGSSRTATFSNAGLPSGKYTLQVRVRNLGSTRPYDSARSITMLSGNVCSGVAFNASPASPVPPGPPVGLTASADCTESGAEYQFLYRPVGAPAYTELRTWGGSTFTWPTAALGIGDYQLLVRARGAGNTTPYESQKVLPYSLADDCSAVTASVSPPSPQASGTPVTIFGAATCAAGGTPQLRYLYRLKGAASWTEIAPWGNGASAVWATTGLAGGAYQLRVESRAPGYSGRWQGAKVLSYALNSPCPTSFIVEFAVPPPATLRSGIAAGLDGNLWFTEFGGVDVPVSQGHIGRITPCGAVTLFPVPTALGGPSGITAGPDGNLWFTEWEGNNIGRVTPSGSVTEFPIPTPASNPGNIAPGPDGNLWFTEFSGGNIARITPGGVVTEFPVPSPDYPGPRGIVAGPDGNLWFAQGFDNEVGRMTPSGTVTGEFAIPTPGSNPIFITAGPDGNLWFTEASANKIARITPAGVITEFPVPTPASFPTQITAASDGNLWFTERQGNKIARITPAGVITEFPIPTPASGAFPIAAGPDGNVWFTEAAGNKIGRLDPP